MNRYLRPRSDAARLGALEHLNQKGVQDQVDGITYLHPDTLGQIGAFLPEFSTAFNTTRQHDTARMDAVAAANTAVAAVTQTIRRIWNAVKWRKKQDGLPASIYLFYGLPTHGKNPTIRSQEEWLVKASSIIQGEANAVAAGYSPLTEPTIAELELELAAAWTAVNQRDAARTAHDMAAVALAALRIQANDLIRQAMAELRLALRKETAAHRREIMRGYGARFSQDATETPALSGAEVAAAAEPAAETTPASEPEFAAMSMAERMPVSNGKVVEPLAA